MFFGIFTLLNCQKRDYSISAHITYRILFTILYAARFLFLTLGFPELHLSLPTAKGEHHAFLPLLSISSIRTYRSSYII